MKKVESAKAPAAIGPYSQAVVANGFMFTSGQIPLSPETGEIVGTNITEQAHQVMKNLGALLESVGCTYASAIKTTCFLSDMENFQAFNEVYSQYFTEKPARSTFAVKQLPKNALCEVEVIAEV